jgi:hypothetical protein
VSISAQNSMVPVFSLVERGWSALVPDSLLALPGFLEALDELTAVDVVAQECTGAVTVVRASVFVGMYVTPLFRIEIQAKAPEFVRNLRALAISFAPSRIARAAATAAGTSHENRQEFALLDALESAHAVGLPQQYISMMEQTARLRGKLLIRPSLRLWNSGKAYRAVCRTSERRLDDRFGVVIGASILLAQASKALDSLASLKLSLLGDAIGAPEEVSLAVAREVIVTIASFAEEYAPPLLRLIRVCQSILLGNVDQARIARSVDRKFNFENIEKLWENGVCALLQRGCESASEFPRVRSHPLSGSKVRLVDPEGPTIDPDVSIEDAGGIFVICDAKYKVASSANASDVYQLHSYLTRVPAPVGMLIYVSRGETWSTYLGPMSGSGSKLFAVGISAEDVAGGHSVILNSIIAQVLVGRSLTQHVN